ncbi:MAG TPA: Gfo/Idh/MocA family oxidoreductase, partial [Chitinophagaceae bacterium]|nr:Gfo/Idh/MocA family oxidoreductase [Chitinophagaceae bacterium]
MKSNTIPRRAFIRNTSAALALAALKPYGSLISTDSPRRVALIGTGWYGKNDLFRLMQVAPVDVVALCDVDQHLLSEAAVLVKTRLKSNKQIQLYTDHRKLLADHKPEIVLIGTPDHWHAPQTIDAIRAGSH